MSSYLSSWARNRDSGAEFQPLFKGLEKGNRMENSVMGKKRNTFKQERESGKLFLLRKDLVPMQTLPTARARFPRYGSKSQKRMLWNWPNLTDSSELQENSFKWMGLVSVFYMLKSWILLFPEIGESNCRSKLSGWNALQGDSLNL